MRLTMALAQQTEAVISANRLGKGTEFVIELPLETEKLAGSSSINAITCRPPAAAALIIFAVAFKLGNAPRLGVNYFPSRLQLPVQGVSILCCSRPCIALTVSVEAVPPAFVPHTSCAF